MKITDIDIENSLITFNWFQPLLTNNRIVSCYELQLCTLKGPDHKRITLATIEKPLINMQFRRITAIQTHNNDNQDPEDQNNDNHGLIIIPAKTEDITQMDYETMSNKIKTKTYTVNSLHPGGKYSCRIRACIDNNQWIDWEYGCRSDIFSVPARRPNPPTAVFPVLSPTIQDINISEQMIGYQGIVIDNHDNVTISWKNGLTNGSILIDYEIQCARMKDNEIHDLVFLKEETLNKQYDFNNNNNENDLNTKSIMNETSIITDISSTLFTTESIHELPWKNVTSIGNNLGPQLFQLNNLIPGASYVFRIRHNNIIGWSDYSDISPVITTCCTIPPEKPQFYMAGNSYAIIQWNEKPEKGQEIINLSRLDYHVQLGIIPIGQDAIKQPINKNGDGIKWVNINTRTIINPIDYKNEMKNIENEIIDKNVNNGNNVNNNTNENEDTSQIYRTDPRGIVSAVIDNLSSSTWYVVKVRVRTIAGWSPWSEISDAVRTLSVN